MKTKLIKGHFHSSYTVPENGELVTVNTNCEHGDWKTASVFPKKWPTIPKGTKVKVVRIFLNLYGLFVCVEHNGQVYDIEDRFIEGL